MARLSFAKVKSARKKRDLACVPAPRRFYFPGGQAGRSAEVHQISADLASKLLTFVLREGVVLIAKKLAGRGSVEPDDIQVTPPRIPRALQGNDVDPAGKRPSGLHLIALYKTRHKSGQPARRRFVGHVPIGQQLKLIDEAVPSRLAHRALPGRFFGRRVDGAELDAETAAPVGHSARRDGNCGRKRQQRLDHRAELAPLGHLAPGALHAPLGGASRGQII